MECNGAKLSEIGKFYTPIKFDGNAKMNLS